MDRLDDISVFVRIVENNGISAAAHRLQLSKSVVSRRLNALEQRLGVRLLARTTRSQKLTEDGQRFYERCARILGDLEDAEANVAQSHSTLSGQLRITAPIYFGQYHLAPIVAEFMNRYPAVRIDLDLTDQHASIIEQGYDLAIRIGRLGDSSLKARKLLSVPLWVCASPQYLEASGTPEDPTVLNGHRGLLHRSGEITTEWSYENADHATMRARIRHSLISNNDVLLLEAAKRGQGLVCLPKFVVHQSVAAGELVQVMKDVRWHTLDVQAVYPATRYLANRVRTFVDALTSNLIDGQVGS